MKKIMCLAVAITALGILVSSMPAGATITATGPFAGALQETWESFTNYQQGPFYLPDPTPIMGGNASISNPIMVVYEPGAGASFGLGGFGPAPVSDGAKGMGLDGDQQTATIVFANPTDSFGPYVVIDGLQANGGGQERVPELPAPLLAMIPGALGILWRGRK